MAKEVNGVASGCMTVMRMGPTLVERGELTDVVHHSCRQPPYAGSVVVCDQEFQRGSVKRKRATLQSACVGDDRLGGHEYRSGGADRSPAHLSMVC